MRTAETGNNPCMNDDTTPKDVLEDNSADGSLDDQPDGDRQLTTNSAALDEGGSNDSDLGANVAGDIGPKHK